MMKVTQLVRALGKAWIGVALTLILFGFAGIALTEGLPAAFDTFSPFNFANTFVVLILLAPGFGALRWAQNREGEAPLDEQEAEAVIEKYARVMEAESRLGKREEDLPYPKHRIKEALRIAARSATDMERVEVLGAAHALLADYQPDRAREVMPSANSWEIASQKQLTEMQKLIDEWKVVRAEALERIQKNHSTRDT